jgi:hypothetical protein
MLMSRKRAAKNKRFRFKDVGYLTLNIDEKQSILFRDAVLGLNSRLVIIIFFVALRPNAGHGLLILEVF